MLFCPLCGQRVEAPRTLAEPKTSTGPDTRGPKVFPVADDGGNAANRHGSGGRDPGTAYLFLALVAAPVFAATPYLSLVGWFFAALVHEMGHTAMDWLFGAPAFPVLSLTAEAMTVSVPQVRGFVFAIWFALPPLAWTLPLGRARLALAIVASVAYPLLAFGASQTLLRALGGHLGELMFASLGVWRCLSGGFTNSRGERLLYGVLGFFLFGKNLWLSGGLLFSASARAAYGKSGSFGLRNDYLVVADNGFPAGLAGVSITMSVVALALVAASLGAWRLGVAASRSTV